MNAAGRQVARTRAAVRRGTGARARAPCAAPALAPDPYADSDAPRWLKYLWRTLSAAPCVRAAVRAALPVRRHAVLHLPDRRRSRWCSGLIALSLTFLGGYGGMVSLAQMTVAGIAGYAVAILGTSSGAEISLGWPWWVAVPFAVLIATVCATLIGWLSVRTEGIYTIMITLAIGVAFYYLVLQNYSVFNGFQGLREVYPPTVFGIDWRDPVPFYFLALVCALAGYFLVRWVVRAPFGIALQGIRDNPRRMDALGFTSSRTASPPMRWPGCSPRSAACCWSGTTG